jgi:2-octaprenyl-6-methoxyphenol hydroxylase
MAPLQSVMQIAVVGAGPVGLALALLAARRLPTARISVFDARPLDRDVGADPRTLALSLGSVQLRPAGPAPAVLPTPGAVGLRRRLRVRAARWRAAAAAADAPC